jgi:hypothetical protein
MEFVKRDFRQLVYSLLCNRQRRQRILLQWHSQPPFKESNVVAMFKHFIDCILYTKLQFTMTKAYISFFNGALKIPYSWLMPSELELTTTLYHHREDVFATQAKDGGKLTHCRLNSSVRRLFNIEARRKIVRDLTAYMLHSEHREFYLYVLLQTTQRMIGQQKQQTDRFVFELHHMLQHSTDPQTAIKNLIVIL